MRLYSAVVDSQEIFSIQAECLVHSLIGLTDVRPEQILLHVVGEMPTSFKRSFNQLGVELVPISPFPGHPYCNKLQQLQTLLHREWDDAVLLDCDVVVLEGPPRSNGALRGKAVDFGNPPMPVLEEIFTKAKVRLTPWTTDIDQLPTAWANCNGGVYVIDSDLINALAPAWLHWANWGMKNLDLFKTFWQHVDQVSFAMAVVSEGLPFESLEPRYNFPTHVPQSAERDCDPAVIHYHRSTDSQHCLQAMDGLPRVNTAINQVNELLRVRRRQNSAN